MEESVKKGVASSLKDPMSAQFGVMSAGQKSDGIIIVCGFVNAKNFFGGYAGAQPFIAGYLKEANITTLFRVSDGTTGIDGADIVSTICERDGIRL
jgi:hypothetical protein